MSTSRNGRLIRAGDTQLYAVEHGPESALPLFVLHGGPGLDHTMFGSHLDLLAQTYRLVLVDGREQGRSERGTDPAGWTLQQHARDVSALAASLGVERYAVLGHSFGAFVALQHAADFPGAAAATIVSSGVPSTRFLDAVEVEDALPLVTQPVLVLAGRFDRTCVPAASEQIAALIPGSQLHVFEESGHMTFVEQEQEYLDVVRQFLDAAD